MYCTRCGNSLPDNARVCGRCGQTIAKGQASQKQATSMPSQPPKQAVPSKAPYSPSIPNNAGQRKCTRCGNPLVNNARVCGKCGQIAANTPVSPKQAAPTPSQPPKAATPPLEAPNPQPIPQRKVPVSIPVSPKRKRFFPNSANQKVASGSMRRHLIRYLIVILVVAALGCGIYMLYDNHHAPQRDPSPEKSTYAPLAPEEEQTPLETEPEESTYAPLAPEEEQAPLETEPAEVTPTGNFSSTYITDGGVYTIAVGDSFTMYHPRTPTSTYYAYTWIIESGEECVELDRGQGTCNVIGIKPGTVKLMANLDYTVLYGYGSQSYSYEYEVTIHVKESGNYDHGDVTDGLCPRCHGSRTVDCTVCYGDGKLTSGKACTNCSNGKVTCPYCDGKGTWK